MREIDEFVSYCTGVRQLRESTAKTYQAQVENFFFYVDKAPGDVGAKDVEEFFNSMRKKGKKQNTIRLHKFAVEKFFEWYEKTHGKLTPCAGIGKIREFVNEPDVPTPDELLDIIREIDDNPKLYCQALRFRNCALVALFAETGMRMQEMEKIKVGDVRCVHEKKAPHHFEVTIFDSKGSSSRIIPCLPFKPGRLTEYFARYFTWLITDVKPRPESPLFFQLSYPGLRKDDRGKALRRTAIQRIIQKARRKAGIDKKISAHTIRHFYGTHCVINGMDVRVLQYLLGHKDLKTTLLYVHIASRVDAEPVLKSNATSRITVNPNVTGFAEILKNFYTSI